MNKIKILLLFVALFAAGLMTGHGHGVAAFFALTMFMVALGLTYRLGYCHLNTLTSLTPDIYGALDVVSRELIGFIPAVARDPRADRVAKGATFRSPVTPANTASSTTPAMSIPSAADQTIGNASLTVSVYQEASFSWNGEEEYAMNTGAGFANILQDQFAQCFRVLTNAMEATIATSFAAAASRAYGTAGTDPFAAANTDVASGNLKALAQLKKILDDNGAPGGQTPGARSVVLSTAQGASLRALYQLTKANEAASADPLRRGTLMDIYGFDLKESAQIPISTAGTMANATSTSAAFTVGQTVIPLATAGTGVVAAGDIITFANDTNKYVVAAVSFAGANPASGDTITLAAPGLRKAQGVATRAITVGAAATINVGFTRNAGLLATRLQIVPSRGDLATDRMVVTDPVSGISYEIAYYPGYRMGVYKVLNAYGFSVFKPEHAAILLA